MSAAALLFLLAADGIDLAQGLWELDPEHTEDVGTYACTQAPMKVTVERALARYVSTRNGYTEEADILAVGPSMIHIRYRGEERLDDAGRPVEWFMVFLDPDTFVWVRKDWYESGRNGSTPPRRRCTPTPGV